MTARLSPQAALFDRHGSPPPWPPCVHYAGSVRQVEKALALQAARGPVFDVAADCEDGAAIGAEAAHARALARLIAGEANRHDRVGARIHGPGHPAWRDELEILVGDAGDRLAFLTLPKAESAADVLRFLDALALEDARRGLGREIPVSVLVETHGAVRDAWAIAALPGVASLDFGTLDFVSAHRGAIALSAMESPGQFDHPLVRRAKCEMAAAALAHDRIPVHGVTRAIGDPQAVYDDARRAREEFGFLRMWSIHPAQIDPILRAMQPDAAEIEAAAGILAAAQAADWAPLAIGGKMHDLASYRYHWSVLGRAKAAGVPLPATRPDDNVAAGPRTGRPRARTF
jgi:citrate lyase subunit beta / citryl-CoA lyase